MDKKELISRFIDSLVKNDNENEQKTIVSSLAKMTAAEILSNNKNGEFKLSENHSKFVAEGMLGDDIEIDGDKVFFKGKKVGRLRYEKSNDEPIDGDDEDQLVFITNDGFISTIKNNDLEDLARVIYYKFGDKK